MFRLRREFTAVEDEVVTGDIGVCLNGAGRNSSSSVGVNTHRAEVASKSWLKEGARRCVQPITRRVQNCADDVRAAAAPYGTGRQRLTGSKSVASVVSPLIFIFNSARRRSRGRPHHAIGDRVCLLLLRIAGLINCQLCLNLTASQ